MMGTESMPKYWLPWLVGMPAEQSRAACCLIFGGVLERLPKLRVCLAHGGGSFPYTIGRIEHGFNMRPDLVATDNFRNPREVPEAPVLRFLGGGSAALRYLLDTCGIDRVMLGTDYPFPLGEQAPAKASNAWTWTSTTRPPLPRHRAGMARAAGLEVRMSCMRTTLVMLRREIRERPSRDAADPLRDFRDEFHLPLHDGKPQAYFVGNSLGLQPKGARAHVEEVLDKWATAGRRRPLHRPGAVDAVPRAGARPAGARWSARCPGKWWR
jgi:hypothetical protein